jgi:hypothetical protein
MKQLNLILSSTMLCLVTLMSSAQEKSTEERAKHMTEKMTKSLLLSSDQQDKVFTLNYGIAQKNEAIRKDANLTKEQKIESIKENMNIRRSSLKTILNEEQFKKFEKLEENRKEEVKKSHKEKKQHKITPDNAPKQDEL